MQTKYLDELTGLNKFTENAKKAIVQAYEIARNKRMPQVLPDHLFAAILMNKKSIATRLLEKLNMDAEQTIESIIGVLEPSTSLTFKTDLSEAVKKIISESFLLSREFGHVYVGTEHILLVLLKHLEFPFVKDLNEVGLSYETIVKNLFSFATYQPGMFTKLAENPEELEDQSALTFFMKEMNKEAQDGKYMEVVGREEEIDRIVHILSRKTKNNPILVGEAGVGKTAIVQGLAERIVQGNVPASFKNKKIVQLDISAIVAGSKVRGDIEERLLAIVNEVAEDRNIIVFIDEIHMIVGAGAASNTSMDIANILKPHLTSGDFRVIGATTFDEYQQYFEEDDALSRRFQPVRVNEISQTNAIKVLGVLKKAFEAYHNVNITPEAVEEAVKLSHRYITDRYLPDKAIDLLDEASASLRINKEKKLVGYEDLKSKLENIKLEKTEKIRTVNLEEALKLRQEEKELEDEMNSLDKRESKRKKATVDVEDIKSVVSKWTGIPINTMNTSDIKSLRNLEEELSNKIIGQEKALQRVASALKRARVGLSDASRPLASFLFLGPTGVGKTEMAKVIAKELFGSEENLIQVDMSEYMEQYSVSKLIGSPPGYVGFQEGGQLTEKIRRKPYSVVLFDEIEKAHPDLLNILLQVLDEGHLQDSKGRKINFKNTIIIMTSNIGAQAIGDDRILGFDLQIEDKGKNEKEVSEAYKKMEESLMEELKETLTPEFLNRLDDIIIFRGLDEKDAKKITKNLLKELNERLKDKKITLDVDNKIADKIVKEGFSKDYGARNLRRKIQELIENELAQFLIDNGITFEKPKDKRPHTVAVKEKNGETEFALAK